MRTMTATEASRRFSDLLDAIERGETIIITRGQHPVAEIGPARRRTGVDLRAALAGIPPPDDRFAHDIAAALALVSTEERDTWADASAARAADRARALAAITSIIEVLDYTETTAAHHARLIAHVRQAGTPRGAHDLLIAAHAAQTGRTILSYDAKARFADLPGVLAVEP